MKVLSSLEIKAVVEELQVFVNGKVDQVYQPDNSEIILALHKRDYGKKYIRIVPGVALYVSKKKRKSPPLPINFCRFLRKRIKGNKVKKIEQKGFERIVEFHFEGKEENFVMICEFFSKGNVVLCNEEGIIISALQVQLWKDRKIKARVKYEYPPSKPVYFDEFQEFAYFIERSDKSTIVKKLATLNLGGLYAEEICFRAKVDKNAEEVDGRQLKKLFVQLQELFKEVHSPNLVNNQPVPFAMESLGEGELFTTYSEALDAYYSQFIVDIDEEEEKEKLSKKDKYKIILDSQEKQQEEVRNAIDVNRKKGDWIYANYPLLQEYLKLYKENKHDELKSKGVKIEGTNLIVVVE